MVAVLRGDVRNSVQWQSLVADSLSNKLILLLGSLTSYDDVLETLLNLIRQLCSREGSVQLSSPSMCYHQGSFSNMLNNSTQQFNDLTSAARSTKVMSHPVLMLGVPES